MPHTLSHSPSNLQVVLRARESRLIQNNASDPQKAQEPAGVELCALCSQPLPNRQEHSVPYSAALALRSLEPMYFASLHPTPENSRPASPVGSGYGRSSTPTTSDQLSEDCFAQGYFNKFFVKQRKLGRGSRGTVYLVQHVLDHHELGHYACKLVSVGDSSRSLLSSLREIKYLESLRHANIISYQHAWLESYNTTPFAPTVPHLFILMSFANGGSLEQFLSDRRSDSSSEGTGDLRKLAFKARKGKQQAVHYLRLDEICALFR